MSARKPSPSAAARLEHQLLLQLGDRLKRARVSRGVSAAEFARQVGVSRTTLHAVESGAPSPSVGTVVKVLSRLGMAADMALLATGESSARVHSARAAPVAVAKPAKRTADSYAKYIAERLARFEDEVAAGKRDASSLFVFPADSVKASTVRFPRNAFGRPQPW